MEAGRQLIRYVLPGGVAALVIVILELIYSWAWSVPVDTFILSTRDNPITAIGGAVILGFVIYQIYYVFYRPVVDVHIPLKSKSLHLYTIYTSDLGGAALQGLADNPLARGALTNAFNLKEPPIEWEWPPGDLKTDAEREEYTSVLDERTRVMRSLLNLTYDTDDVQIKRSYTELVDIYHAIGACRAAIFVTSAVAIFDILAKHIDDFSDHPVPSSLVTVAAILAFRGAWIVIRVNRRDTWKTMTSQLSSDLRIWALRRPELLAELARSNTPPELNSE